MRSGSLFDTGGLSWYEYRLTPAGDGKIAASDVRFDHTIAVVNGITVNDDRITMKMSSPEMLVIMDKYYDPSSNVQVGSHMKTISGGMTPQNAGLRSGDLYRSHDIVAAYADGNWPLEDRGPETITIDGQSYDCTKYAVGEAGDHGTAWSCDGVPVPVKLETGSADGVQATWELIGRG